MTGREIQRRLWDCTCPSRPSDLSGSAPIIDQIRIRRLGSFRFDVRSVVALQVLTESVNRRTIANTRIMAIRNSSIRIRTRATPVEAGDSTLARS